METLTEAIPVQETPDDESLLVEAARQNPEAFAALYCRYLNPVYRYLYSRVQNRADAEDLTTQVFIEILEGLARYRDRGTFAARLQRELRARAEQLESPQTSIPRPSLHEVLQRGLFRRTWTTAALALVLLLAMAVLLVGPQRVWAGIQQFFRYVPGVGFVDLENARVLPAPVAIERDGITFIVTQVIAAADRTTLHYEIQGLPSDDQIWPNGAELDKPFQPQLRLPDGTHFDHQGLTAGLRNGQIEFPALPREASQITFELDRLPFTPPGMFPEHWSIPLPLRPLEGEPDKSLFPEPYAPENATDTHFGITAQVLQVAHAPEGTALQIQVSSDYLFRDIHPASDGQLRDDVGHIYHQNYEVSASSVQVMEVRVNAAQELSPANDKAIATAQTFLFYPVSLSARQLTFEIQKIETSLSVRGSFTINLGDSPQIGDIWELNLPLEIAGLTARITSAQLIEDRVMTEDGFQSRKQLEFLIEAEPDEEGAYLSTLGFSNPQDWFRSWGTDISEPGFSKTYFIAETNQPFPHGELTINIKEANIAYPGPWILTWPIPRGETDPNQATRPVTLQPNVSDTQNDLTLTLSEVVQTDRLLALALQTENFPPGAEFLEPIPWGTNRFNQAHVTLTDNLGNTAFPSYWNIEWEPYRDHDFRQTHLTFPPPNPLASRLTLTIPVIRLFFPAEASFDVTLPSDKAPILQEIENPSDIPPDGSWAIDIPLEIAGFQVHFTQAWLEEFKNPTSLVLFAEDVNGQIGNFYLSGLQMEIVQNPDGRIWSPFPHPGANSFAGQMPGGSYYAMLIINAFNPQTLTLPPGPYHVQLNGVVITVPGPWKLSWNLTGP